MKKRIIVIILACMCMSACRTAPIYNVEKQNVPATTIQEVEKAIFSGAARKGWDINKEQDGLMVATLKHGRLLAEVEIPYSENSYSIYYKNSKHLRYWAWLKRIHVRYNRWVKYLRNSINASFAGQ